VIDVIALNLEKAMESGNIKQLTQGHRGRFSQNQDSKPNPYEVMLPLVCLFLRQGLLM
jgi:hypothetical protein